MKKFILFSILIFVLASISFAGARGTTKRDYMFNLPDDINWGTCIQTLVDLPAASTTSILATTTISTTTLTADGTSYALASSDYTDVIFPRNLVVDAMFDTGEATTTVTGSMVITGTDQLGNSTTETVAVTTNSATGVVAWSTVTNLAFSDFVITGASSDNIKLSVGTGNKIALANNVRATGDIIKVIGAGATDTTYTLNTTYDTIEFATDPNATYDYFIYYISRTQRARLKY